MENQLREQLVEIEKRKVDDKRYSFFSMSFTFRQVGMK